MQGNAKRRRVRTVQAVCLGASAGVMCLCALGIGLRLYRLNGERRALKRLAAFAAGEGELPFVQGDAGEDGAKRAQRAEQKAWEGGTLEEGINGSGIACETAAAHTDRNGAMHRNGAMRGSSSTGSGGAENRISGADVATECEEAALSQARLARYALLAQQNKDLTGWIQIDGTKIDYPVMQTREEPEFYLHRGFDREHAYSGLPFLDARCASDEDCAAFLVYAHNMRDGSMFAGLHAYRERAFWEAHRTVTFDLLEHAGSYQVFAAFHTDLAEEQRWYFPPFSGGREEFEAYAELLCGLSFYDTGIRPAYGSRILLLVTCSSQGKDGRMVVAAVEAG